MNFIYKEPSSTWNQALSHEEVYTDVDKVVRLGVITSLLIVIGHVTEFNYKLW